MLEVARVMVDVKFGVPVVGLKLVVTPEGKPETERDVCWDIP